MGPDDDWRDEELERELAAESGLPTAPPGRRRAIYAGVLAAVAPTVAAAGSALTFKLLVGVGVLAVGGAATVTFMDTPAEVEVRAPAAAPAPARPAAAVPALPARVVQEHVPAPAPEPEVKPEPARPKPVMRAPAPKPRASTLGAEQALLAQARRAIAGGEPAVALRAVSSHAKRFAGGALVQEREVLRIQALARAGRMDEARQGADRFRSRYPRSLLIEAVEYAVER